MQYSVQDSGTTLKFDGTLLADSSSKGYRPRWVEFQLYKTASGSYILYRVGKSLLFHTKSCKIVSRNNLKRVDEVEIPLDAVACEECAPLRASGDGLFPETDRHFALRTTTAKGVLAGLMQYDENNSEYLTNVARDLLMTAAKLDDGIHSVLFERFID